MGCAVQLALKKRKSSREPSLRQVVAALLMLVFANANYAVQTHIHGASVPSPGIAAVPVLAPLAPATPLDNDERHCPLCQAFLSGGNFLLPVALMLVLPDVLAVRPMVFSAPVAARASAHSWEGRGPPAGAR